VADDDGALQAGGDRFSGFGELYAFAPVTGGR
jgi:hypothetical protein